MYHVLGQQIPNPGAIPSQNQPPQNPNSSTTHASRHMQGGYDAQGLRQGNQPYPSNYNQAAGQSTTQYQNDYTALNSQMASATLSNQPYGRSQRKKDRHAYHNLESSTGPQTFNGMSQDFNTSQSGPANNNNTSGGQGAAFTNQFNNASLNQSPTPAAFANGPSIHGSLSGNSFGSSILNGSSVSSSQGRVDPEQVPSIPRSRDGPATYYLDHIYPTMERHLPPPTAVPFIAYDQGNASPKHARLTLNNIPATSEALSVTGLPLGLICQPLAPLQDGENPIPTLDFGDSGPPRCRRCRAYINSFMTFQSGGNKFVCNMCNFPNDVPSEYFAPTDPSGVRIDRPQRPELTLGTVEFLVPKEYWANEPVGLRWLFLIDVSAESINKGFASGFCEGILSVLYEGSGMSDTDKSHDKSSGSRCLPPDSKVGLVTFDREIHFYNLSPTLGQAQMMVMSDIDDPFVPLSEGLFVYPQESKDIITSLLTRIPHMFAEIKSPEPALLSTLNAATSALKDHGGKIICSISALPTWGQGRLYLRDDGKGQNPETEKKLLVADNPAWRKTASKMVECGIGIDFFMAAPSGGYLDIATIGGPPPNSVINQSLANYFLGHISAVTGGENFYYPNFHAPRDTMKFVKEISHAVTRETGYQALMKVRCSNGLQVSGYFGNFTHHTFGADLEFGVIDADKAIGITFSYDGKLDPKLDAHFQTALLYTSATGERRVRCSNVVASVSEGALETMKFLDQDAVIHILAKEAASKATERSLKDIRGGIMEKAVDILSGYRKNFSGSHPPGQLVLPENLKEFSMYILGLIKSRAFKGGREPTDRRAHDVQLIRAMGLIELSIYLYPRIYSIHNLDEQDGFANEQGHLRMPQSVRASFSKVEEGGAYIVDNGQVCLLWLHSQVSPNLLEDLFGQGYRELKQLDAFQSILPVLDTHLSAQVRNILQYLASVRGSKALTLQLARQGLDGAEYEFARLLYEDRNNEAQSYVDWLVHLHRQIQLEA